MGRRLARRTGEKQKFVRSEIGRAALEWVHPHLPYAGNTPQKADEALLDALKGDSPGHPDRAGNSALETGKPGGYIPTQVRRVPQDLAHLAKTIATQIPVC